MCLGEQNYQGQSRERKGLSRGQNTTASMPGADTWTLTVLLIQGEAVWGRGGGEELRNSRPGQSKTAGYKQERVAGHSDKVGTNVTQGKSEELKMG